MKLFLIALLCFFIVVQAYEKPNYPKRPLSNKENEILLKSCGVNPIDHFRQKVWNPNLVNRTVASWAVAVLFTHKWTPNMTVEEMYMNVGGICSGSLISPRHVLTAAHCIKPNILRTLFVVDTQCAVNQTSCPAQPRYLRTAARAFSSVRFAELNPLGTEANGADLAVFELTEDIPINNDVWPVCLGDENIGVGEKLDLYGYGLSGTSKNTFALQHSLITAANCKDSKLDQFCSNEPYQKPCGGDSGAGIIRTDRHDRKLAVGTHTAGFKCEVINQQMVFGKEGAFESTHTSVQPHLFWICEATGICVNEKIVKDVEIWNNLKDRHRVRYVVKEPLNEDQIYV